MKRKRNTWPLRIASALILALTGLWGFSPYRHYDGFRYPLIKFTVPIAAPADSVFRFLGNSTNAARWSVFVNHISTLNGNAVPDGRVGSRRRCFCRANETGARWDEVIAQVTPGSKRQIKCYRLVDFPLSAEGLATEQLYKAIAPDSCELTFTLFYLDKDPSLPDVVKMKFTGYYVRNVFVRNMGNIRRVVEAGER